MSLIILLLSQPTLYDRSFLDFESYWDFYADNRISSSACGMGYTGVAYSGDISSTFINPASLSLKKKQLYFEYVYKDDIEWLFDIRFKNLNPNFSVGAGLPVNRYFQIGITYRTENNFKIDYGEIMGTVLDPTSETGYIETGLIDVYTNMKISTFSLPIVFKLKNVLSVGIDLSYTNFYSKTKLGENVYADTLTDSTWTEPNIFTASFNKIRPKFGIIYFPIENLSFGLTYLPEARETITIEEYTYDPNIFPSKIGVGISYKLNFIPLYISLDYKRSNNSAEAGLVDRKDIHFGLGYDINNNFTLRTGFFTQKDYRSISSQSNLEEFGLGNYDQIFTTLGLSYKMNFLTLNLSLMDSHLFSDGSIEQTYVSTGISYGF